MAIERRHFDAWGNLATLQQNGVAIVLPTDGTATKLLLLDRGYTSHEHLSEVGLIHMNGRLYDPVLRSFLMPDNFIQQPENTQNYNRYTYVLNNPLMYTDPSGELLITTAILIGALVAAATYTMTALLADVPFSVGGLLKATFIGAASAAVTFGIGTGAENLFTNFFSKAAFQAVAHGTFQGGMTAISGGKFWSGFAAGALSSIASSAWGGGTSQTEGFSAENNWAYGAKTIHHAGLGAGTGTAGMIAFGTVAGGAGAALTGGNFWQGAVTGLVVSGLNHAAHEMDGEDGSPKSKPKSKIIKDRFKFVKNTTKSIEGMSEAFNVQGNAGKYVKFIGKHSGTFSSATEVALNAYEYRTNVITGERLTYRTIGTGLGAGVGLAAGGLPGFGLGVLIDLSFSSVETAYDTIAPQVKGSFNQFVNNVNFACANAQK